MNNGISPLANRHNIIHLSNPNTNYIILENCPYCKLNKRNSYGNSILVRNQINRRQYYTYINSYYRYRQNNINQRLNNELNSFEDVVIHTPLQLVNKNSKVYLSNTNNNLCIICQETINYNSIVRELSCKHMYHLKCIDTWLETNKKCPLCNKYLI